MKLKSRLTFFTSTVANDDDNSEKSNSKSFSVTTITPTTSLQSLQSNASIQTLPSVQSLQIHQVDPTPTHSLSSTSSLTLPSSITSISLSSTSPPLLYVSSCHQIHVYNPATLTHLETFNANSPSSGSVKCIAFSKHNNVLTAHQDGKIRVWKIIIKPSHNQQQQHKLVSTLPTLSDRIMQFPLPKNHVKVRRHKTRLWVEHNDAVSSLAVNVKEGLIYSVSWDKTMKMWGKSDLRCKESVTASEDAVNAVIVSVNGLVFTGSAEGRIKVWSRNVCGDEEKIKSFNPKEKKHSLVATLEKHKSAVNALALNSDGSILFSGACDRSILVWEREDTAKYMTVSGALRGHQAAILCLINVSDFLISGSADQTVRIWRRGSDGKFCCLTVLTGHRKAVKCLAGKMEGRDRISVFSGGLDGEIRVWSVNVNRN